MSDDRPDHLIPVAWDGGDRNMPAIRDRDGRQAMVSDASTGQDVWITVGVPDLGQAQSIRLPLHEAVKLAEQILHLCKGGVRR